MTPDPFSTARDLSPLDSSMLPPSLAGTNPGKPPDFGPMNNLISLEQKRAQKAATDEEADRAAKAKLESSIEKTEDSVQDLHAQRIESLQNEEQQLEQAKAMAPKDHLSYVMTQVPLFMLITAFASGITRKASATALSSLNGMVQGMQKGSADQYQQANEQYQQAMKTLQEKWALRDKIYDQMEGAYGDSIKGQQRRWQIANAAIENDQASADKSFTNMRELTTAEAKIQEQYATRKQAASVNPAQIMALAKDVAEYRIPFTAAAGRMPPAGRDMLAQQVQQLNPNYSTVNFTSMNHAALAWSGSGKNQQQLNSFNTATGHLEQLEKLGQALQNGEARSANAIVNLFKEQFNNPTLATYDAIKGIVADEVVRIATGGQGALADRQQQVANFVNTTDQQALHGVIQGYKGIMGERLAALEVNYQTDFMGQPPVPFEQRLTPPAQRSYQLFQAKAGNAGALNKAPQQPPNTAFPDPGKEARYQAWKAKQATANAGPDSSANLSPQ